MTFEEWMRRYIDHIAKEAAMERSAVVEMYKDDGLDSWCHACFKDDLTPEEAADEELSNWNE